MPDSNVMINLLVNAKTAKPGLKEFESYVNKLQRQAASGGANTKVAQLPRQAKNAILDRTQVVNGKDTAELKKQEQALARMARERGKLVGLAQAEASMVAKAGGQKVNTTEVGKLRTKALSAFASSLGLEAVPAALEKEFNDAARSIRNAVSKGTSKLDAAASQVAFRDIANKTLREVGIEQPTRIRRASTLPANVTTRREAAPGPTAILERPTKVRAPKTTEAADTRALKAAESNAADAEQSAKSQKASRAKSDTALKKKAESDQKRVIQLTKAQAAELQHYLDTEAASGMKPSGVIGGPKTRPTFSYDRTDANRVTSLGRSIEDIGQDNNDRVRINTGNKLIADATEAQARNELEILAAQEAAQTAEKAAEKRTVEAKKTEAKAAEKQASNELKWTRDYAQGGASSYSTMSQKRDKGYIISKDGPSSPYKVYDEQSDNFRPEKYNKLKDAKEAVQNLENNRLASLQSEVQSEQQSAAVIKNENAKQVAAEKKTTKLKESYFSDYSSARVDPNSGYISNLATRSDKRGQGEASNVMRQITADADALGQKLMLSARDDLEGFYNQFGFKKTDQKAFGQPVYEREAGAQAVAEKTKTQEKEKQVVAEKKTTTATQKQAITTEQNVAKLSSAQQKALAAIQASPKITAVDLKAQGVKTNTLNSLEKAGIVKNTNGKYKDPTQAVEKKPRRNREQILNDAERSLIDALNSKKKALNAQTKVLKDKLNAFTNAEKDLISALNGKTSAIKNQTRSVKNIPSPSGGNNNNTPPPKNPGGNGPTSDPGDEFNAEDAARARVAAALNERATLEELFVLQLQNEYAEHIAVINTLNKRIAGMSASIIAGSPTLAQDFTQGKAEEQVANTALQAQTNENLLDPNNLLGPYLAAEKDLAETTARLNLARITFISNTNDLAETEAALKVASQRLAAARLRALNTSPDRQDFIDSSASAQADKFSLDTDVRAALLQDDNYNKSRAKRTVNDTKQKSKTANEVASDPALFAEEIQAQTSLYLASVKASAAKWAEISKITSIIVNDAVEEKTARDNLTKAINDEYLRRKAAAAGLPATTENGQAVKAVDAIENRADVTEGIANNSSLEQRYVSSQVRLIEANNKLAAKVEVLATSSDSILASRVERYSAQQRANAERDKQFLDSTQGQNIVRQQAENAAKRRRIREGDGPQGAFGKFTNALGYKSSGASSPLGFFGGGALASLRYGLPSMLLYGAGGGIMSTIKEAEELQVSLAKLESQFNAVFQGQDFGPIRQQILNVAQDTGLAADEIANLQIQITGAFAGNDTNGAAISIDGASGQELVQKQVASAAKLAQTVGLPLAEITDGLTAASLAFDSSFEQIGDVALSVEQSSGVLAKETISFIGDIAPVAQEAGYSLEEFAALAAVAQQRSGRSGTALAESFGRVIPAITESKDKLLELASIDPTIGTDSFVDAIRNSDPKAILDEIGKSYNSLNKEAKQAVVTILGGRREAQALIPALANRNLVEDYKKIGEESTGTLEERFQKIRATLTNTIQRITELVRQVGVELLEAGIADAFENALKIAKLFLNILSPIARVVSTINDALGGIPVQLLLGVAALKLFTSLLSVDGAFLGSKFATATRAGVGAATSNVANNFRQGVTNSIGMNPNSLAGAQALRTSTLIGSASGALGKGKAIGQGVLSAIGGGSVALGGAFVGITALAGLYSVINSRIEKDKAAMKELQSEIKLENSQLDLDTDIQRGDRAASLRATSERVSRDVAGWGDDWKRFWNDLFNIQSEAEVYAIEAIKVARNPEYDKALNDLGASAQDQLLNAFGNSFETSGPDLKNNQFPGMGDAFEKLFPDSGINDWFKTGFGNRDTQGVQQEKDIANLLGLNDYAKANDAVLEALNSPQKIKALQDIVNTSTDTDAVEQAAAALDNIAEELINGDSREAKRFQFARKRAEKRAAELKELENSKSISDLQGLSQAYQNGLITLEEYLSRSSAEINNIENTLTSGTDTKATEQEKLDASNAIIEGRKQQTQAILDAQDKQAQIAEALGASDTDIRAAQVAAARANLADPNFTDDEKRLEAALLLAQAEARTQLDIARRTGDLGKVYDILANGADVPRETMAILFKESVQDDSFYKDFEEAYGRYIETVFGQLLPNKINGLNADSLLEKVSNEYFSAGGLTGQTESDLLTSIAFTQNQLNIGGDGIPDSVRADMEASIDFWVELLQMTGTSASKIYDALSGGAYSKTKPNSPERKAIEDKYADVLAGQGFDPQEIKAMVDAQNLADEKSLADSANSYFKAIGNTKAQRDALGYKQIVNKAAADKARAKTAEERSKEDWDALAEEAEINNEMKSLAQQSRDARNNYLIAVAKRSGNERGALNIKKGALEDDLRQAINEGRQDDANNLAAELENTNAEIDKLNLDEALSGIDLIKGLAELSGNIIAIAQAGIARAKAQLAAAKTPQEINSAQLELAQAEQALRKAPYESKSGDYELFAAYLEFNGESLAALKTRVEGAKNNLQGAIAGGNAQEIRAAQIALMEAQTALRQGIGSQRDGDFDLLAAVLAGDDPVKQAIVEQAAAREALARAIGPDETRDATIRLIDANKALQQAQQEARNSMMNLRMSELQAMDDEVGAAKVAAELARQQLNDAIKAGAGTAAINNLRAQVITADKAAADAVINEKLDEYKWLLDMGQITQSQYINYLQGLQSTLAPGSKQFKDLALTIKQLKDGISGDLQANLPTSLALPTLYEVRRFNQTGASSGGATAAGGIGYQDNRNVNINLTLNDASASSKQEIISVMEDALGVGRNGYGDRRY